LLSKISQQFKGNISTQITSVIMTQRVGVYVKNDVDHVN
jgi:hypothetical protein